MSPSDSWYVACALESDAELWLSHSHADGLADKAAAAGCRVYTLAADRFRL